MLLNSLKLLLDNGFYPSNILDIGAYKAEWTFEVLKIFPNSTYHLIEANNYNELNEIKKFSNINVYNEVLLDEIKEVDWYQNNSTGDSIYKEETTHYKKCIPSKKITNTLNNMFSNQTFDLIKIDCQGAELPILKGGLDLLKNTQIIILEMPFVGKYNVGIPNFKEHIDFMNDNGFIVYDIVELHRIKGYLIQIDILFINKNNKQLNIIQEMINNL